MKNRFNKLTSKEWLPFQKSWFRYESDLQLYNENIRFFTKADTTDSVVLYSGHNFKTVKNICKQNDVKVSTLNDAINEQIQFVIFDLRNQITNETTLAEYDLIKKDVINSILSIYSRIDERRFISVYVKNIQINNKYYPFAWDLAKHLSSILSIKDEKIACINNTEITKDNNFFHPKEDFFYCLYFRKDESSSGIYKEEKFNFFKNNIEQKTKLQFNNTIPCWFILKPQPRKKDEILHPAKYPEELVDMFINEFTKQGDNVIDPMSGTGSTQISALKNKRNGYGTELSEFFSGIANGRCKEFLDPSQMTFFPEQRNEEFKILNKDARLIEKSDFPEIDYLITSPPYWDMLNMKGAENQAKRIEKGLQTNYSDDERDLGNMSDYNNFINILVEIYLNIAEIMKPGSYLTIVVKNIKKQGKNYPFAWDLSNALQEKLILLPEVFWCQDDISIAPYGYGNTFVSNTFHQYCLNFQKPINVIKSEIK